jgi:hypothetical protein
MEVADIFRAHGAAWCAANKGHVSLGQLRAISAIKACRTAVLGGHVARCEGCSHTVIGYNLPQPPLPEVPCMDGARGARGI